RGEHSVRASVIIVNYNGGELVRRCVHSILQHIGPDDEVILVDNASTDGSLEAVRSAFPDVTVIQSYENVGFGEGNNAGVRAASGEFLAFLNPDTIVESDWITPLLAPLMSDPAVGMTTSRILLLDDPARVN